MIRTVRGRWTALLLFICAVVTIGLAVAGGLPQIRGARAPVVVVAK
jgi:hypothetical protein